MAHWIFSNKAIGYYEDTDWDTATILRTKRYYFKTNEPNRTKVVPGDIVLFREYGVGFWGTAEISGSWIHDNESTTKYSHEAGWFPITKVKQWGMTLPYELVRDDLSNKNYRIRIAKCTKVEHDEVLVASRVYQRLGFGRDDGTFFVLESGLEEAVKANLKQLGLRLADADIRQQCSLGIGAGRTDLICLDQNSDFVILELKAVHTSDEAVGQILRYMGFVREKWAEASGKKVRGIILSPSFDEQLRLAAKEAGIKVLNIRIN
jgi:hypothetical protein